MGVFKFQAKTPDGRIKKGEVNASSEEDARAKLTRARLAPISVVEKGKMGINLGGTGISSKELQSFTRQFAVLIGAGVPIVQALEALSRGDGGNEKLKDIIKNLLSKLEKGSRLSDAMEGYPDVFDKIYVSLVGAAEESGSLDVVLNQLATYIEKSNKLKSKVKGALAYPIAILVISIIVIVAILVFVIPAFQDLFSSSGKDLPSLTAFVVALSEGFKSYWYIFAGLGVALFVGGKAYVGTEDGEKNRDFALLKAPLLGSLVLKSCIARFSRTLSILLSAGVQLVEALEIGCRTVGNHEVEKVLQSSKNSVIQGKTFSGPLINSELIPDMVSQMISIGEESGNLDLMLNKIADFYEEEVETSAETVTSLIEPFMMVFLGGIIAVLVVAMYLPIFNMAGAMGGG